MKLLLLALLGLGAVLAPTACADPLDTSEPASLIVPGIVVEDNKPVENLTFDMVLELNANEIEDFRAMLKDVRAKLKRAREIRLVDRPDYTIARRWSTIHLEIYGMRLVHNHILSDQEVLS